MGKLGSETGQAGVKRNGHPAEVSGANVKQLGGQRVSLPDSSLAMSVNNAWSQGPVRD